MTEIEPFEDYYPQYNPKEERKQFKQKIKKVKQTSKTLSSKEKAQENPLSLTQIRKIIKYEEELEKQKYLKKKDKDTKLYNEKMKLYVKHNQK